MARSLFLVSTSPRPDQASLARRSYVGLAELVGVIAAVIFLTAGSFRYWQAWLYLAIMATSNMAITAYFLKRDPALIERRLKGGPAAEKEPRQKVIVGLVLILFVALYAVAGLDHRFGWSQVSPLTAIVGDVLVALGMAFVFRVFKENSFASAVVEVSEQQKVISTGPYAWVRHPMYSGFLIFMIGTPLALGSLWGLVILLPMAACLVARLQEEEKVLERQLPGYSEYRQRTRARLVPGIF